MTHFSDHLSINARQFPGGQDTIMMVRILIKFRSSGAATSATLASACKGYATAGVSLHLSVLSWATLCSCARGSLSTVVCWYNYEWL